VTRSSIEIVLAKGSVFGEDQDKYAAAKGSHVIYRNGWDAAE